MTSEAELVAPEWKVYFDGDFWGHRGKDRAGKESKLSEFISGTLKMELSDCLLYTSRCV